MPLFRESLCWSKSPAVIAFPRTFAPRTFYRALHLLVSCRRTIGLPVPTPSGSEPDDSPGASSGGIRRAYTKLLWRFSLRRFGNTFRWIRQTIRELQARRREERLTVAVEHRSILGDLTGIGWYVYRLLENLSERDDLRLRLYGPTLVESEDMPVTMVEILKELRSSG